MRSFICGVIAFLLCAAPLALGAQEMPIQKGGTGVAVTCDNPAAAIDDTSVANTYTRTLVCTNPSTNTVTVRIGGSSVGANGEGLEPGQSRSYWLKPSAALKCYAAAATTIQCTEFF